jgi:hypothetical protein
MATLCRFTPNDKDTVFIFGIHISFEQLYDRRLAMTDGYYVIDRYEEDQAVLVDDNRGIHRISVSDLPASCSEGDVLLLVAGAWKADVEETKRRRQNLNTRLQNLFAKGKIK